MTAVDIDARIPNNVDLADDRRLQRALESWQPKFIEWWKELGPGRLPGQRRLPAHRGRRRPGGLGQLRPRARCPTTAGASSSPSPKPTGAIAFGDHLGEPVVAGGARRVPRRPAPPARRAGRHRAGVGRAAARACASPRRASTTCATCSRSTSRRAATCGRWCTCCTATSAATAATRPTSCSSATPATPTTRASSARSTSRRPTGCRSSSSPTSPTATASSSWPRCAESAFDPLSRTCDFMLKEEAHHMFVGATGVGRVVQRTVELMKEHDTDDVGPFGGIDVATLQRYLNFHYSVSLDLFGAETSTNAANYFAAGLKGRFQEERRDDDHRLHDATARRADGRRRRRSATREVAGAGGAQRDAARRLHRRLPEGRRPLEPDAGRGRPASCACRTSGSTARVGAFARPPRQPRRPARRRRRRGTASRRRLAADRRRPGPRRVADASASPSRGGWPAGSRRRRPASTPSRSTSSTCGSEAGMR